MNEYTYISYRRKVERKVERRPIAHGLCSFLDGGKLDIDIDFAAATWMEDDGDGDGDRWEVGLGNVLLCFVM